MCILTLYMFSFLPPSLSLFPLNYPVHVRVLVRGCDFQYDGNQISLGTSLKKAVITGNIITVTKVCNVHHERYIQFMFYGGHAKSRPHMGQKCP